MKATVVVENKAGAAGLVSAQSVMRARPEGYTALLCLHWFNGSHAGAGTLCVPAPKNGALPDLTEYCLARTGRTLISSDTTSCQTTVYF